MALHRVAEHPLSVIKDDLLLALQRIRHGLSAYQEDPAESTPLEAMLDAFDQIRSPLVTLEQQQATALLDAMRMVITGLIKGEFQSLDLMVLRQASERLTDYLESCLSPDPQRSDAELSEAIATLRLACQPDALEVGNETLIAPLDPSAARQTLLSTLKRLRQTLAVEMEGAADQPQLWKMLRDELEGAHQLLAAQEWTRAALITGRLERVAAALAAGAASHGPMAAGVLAENLSALTRYLEPLGADRPSSAIMLNGAEEHLAEMEALLQPAATVKSSTPPLASTAFQTDQAVGEARSKPLFSLADSASREAPAAVPAWPGLKQNVAEATEAMTFNLPESDVAGPLAAVEHGPSSVAEHADDRVALIGLADADPEFVEVFLEEACGELATIREQLQCWREDPTHQQALTTMRRAFHTLKGSGRMVGATVIGDFAWEFENLLNQVLNGSLPPTPAIGDAVAAAASALAPLVGEVPLRGDALAALSPLKAHAHALAHPTAAQSIDQQPPPAVEPVAPARSESAATSIAPEIDPEFLEVFLEEARDQLASIREQQAIWRGQLADRQALTTMRRAFHTLKGSGRVVGATVIGDFSWEFENLLNQVLSGTLPASTAVADLIAEAATALEPLIGNAPATDAIKASMAELITRAHTLLQGVEVGVAPMPIDAVSEPISVRQTSVATPLPPPAAPAPAAEVSRPGLPEPAAPTRMDLDLAQVFQYEATEILDASDLILQRLGTETEHSVLLNDLRRNMHTLKGSSRMAGFMAIGDLAHAAESVLDAIGKGDGFASQAALDLLQPTLDHLNQMLGATASGAQPVAATPLIQDLHRLAEAISSGTPAGKLPATAARQIPVSPQGSAVAPSEPVSFRQTMTELDQELVQVFQTEASEILDSSDVILQRLRNDAANVELLNDLRREMHTLKGSSRMAGFMTVGDLAHAAESLLDALGKGTLKGSAPILDYIQRAMDRLHQMLAGVLKGVQPPAQQALIDELHGVLGGKPVAAEPRSRPMLPTVTASLPVATAERPQEPPAAAPADNIRVSAALLTTLVNQMGESSIFRARIDQGVNAMSFNLNEFEQTITRLRRQITHLATQAEARIQSRQDQSAKTHQLEFDPLELDRFTELQQVSRSLMEIADDLGNIGNTLGDHAREVTSLLDQQGKVNKEIQQGLMRTGMVRFGSIIPRLRRVIRQSAQELGKRAELLVGGEEAEVDRNVLENMIAPLEHMLRNSLAHGIEDPERRRLAGKPEIGAISLSLRREGAELVLELSDDGGGLNFEAIRTKGLEKGLLTPDQPASDEDLITLLLRPGFSTAATVTQISGRGVGMDVVNEAIHAMRGALLIQTEPGHGTRFTVRLPFSLAVTQALLVRAGESLFAIPLLSIELVTRLTDSEFKRYLSGEHVQHRYSERNYPVHNLGLLIGVEQVQSFEEATDRRPPTLLFRSAEASAALQVEAVLGNREIIVKPVGPQFNGLPGISGATVLGDGRVVVVLELAALVRNIGSQLQKQAESRALRIARQQETRQEKISVMVIDDSITMRKVTARILERHNIQVVTAKDGLDAVAMLQTQVPDLAILDIEMPRMDGFEVVAHVRNQTHMQHLPIIMVTSRGGEKHRDRAMKLGVNDYLTKPYQEEQLMQSIRRILGERALKFIT